MVQLNLLNGCLGVLTAVPKQLLATIIQPSDFVHIAASHAEKPSKGTSVLFDVAHVLLLGLSWVLWPIWNVFVVVVQKVGWFSRGSSPQPFRHLIDSFPSSGSVPCFWIVRHVIPDSHVLEVHPFVSKVARHKWCHQIDVGNVLPLTAKR